MYYMLILYYEALARNVNLSQVYSVFKKQIDEHERRCRRGERATRGSDDAVPDSEAEQRAEQRDDGDADEDYNS